MSPSQGLCINTGQNKHRINAYTHQTPMPWVGFEPTIPASRQAKTAHPLDHAATVTRSSIALFLVINITVVFVLKFINCDWELITGFVIKNTKFLTTLNRIEIIIILDEKSFVSIINFYVLTEDCLASS
jgi:hypothetical protein